MSPEEEPPRITHVLRPHHIALLSVFILVLRDPVSPGLNLYIWRLLAREIAEVYPPKTFEELIKAITSSPPDVDTEAEKLGRGMRNVPKHLATHDGMSQFFADVIAFVPEKEYEGQQPQPTEAQPIERRSYFGLFIRRCYLSWFKLSWRGAMKLLADYKDWIVGREAGYSLRTSDREGGLLLVPTASDELQYAQVDAYEKYEKAAKTGDTQSAIENLRRFFDQRFSEDKESGVTQHALLNLAHLHYSLGEWSAARQAADEALKIARTANDALTAKHCANLLRRVISLDPTASNRLALDRGLSIKFGTSPIEVLWEIKRLMDQGEPLRVGFTKLYEAVGANEAILGGSALLGAKEAAAGVGGVGGVDASVKAAALAALGPTYHGVPGAWNEDSNRFKWAKHAVQATLWNMAGVESLAQTHEGLVIAFTEAGDDDSRLIALCSRARRLARQGNCGSALVVLLDPETWRGLNLRQYGIWAGTLWYSLAVVAERRSQSALYREFLMPRKPSESPYNMVPSSVFFPKKLDALVYVRYGDANKRASEPAEAIEPLLDGLWQTEFRGLWGLHRTGVIILADVSIEFGMATMGKRIIEEVLPQVLNGDDLEQRAYACYTLGRCIIAASSANEELHTPAPPEKQVTSLLEALPFLHVAERDYGTIEMYEEQLGTLYILSVIYHNLGLLGKGMPTFRQLVGEDAAGMKKQRDRWADKYQEVDKQRREASEMEADEELKEIWDLVIQVAGVISA